MEHEAIVRGLQFCRPGAEFIVTGTEIQWLDVNQNEPTESEIEAAWEAYQLKVQNDKVEMVAKKEQILERLGITPEEIKLLING